MLRCDVVISFRNISLYRWLTAISTAAAQIESLNKTLKGPGMLDKRAAFDTLLQSSFPKVLLCVGADSAGDINARLDYNLSDQVRSCHLHACAQAAGGGARLRAAPRVILLPQIHKAANILEKELLHMVWEAGSGSRKVLSTFKYAYVNTTRAGGAPFLGLITEP